MVAAGGLYDGRGLAAALAPGRRGRLDGHALHRLAPRPTPATCTARRWSRPPTRTPSAPAPIPASRCGCARTPVSRTGRRRPADIQPFPQQAIAVDPGRASWAASAARSRAWTRTGPCFAMGQSARRRARRAAGGRDRAADHGRGRGGDWAGGGIEGSVAHPLAPYGSLRDLSSPIGEEARRAASSAPSGGRTDGEPSGGGRYSPPQMPLRLHLRQHPLEVRLDLRMAFARPALQAGLIQNLDPSPSRCGSGLRPAAPWPRR